MPTVTGLPLQALRRARSWFPLPQQAQTIESISGHTYIRKRISLNFFVKKLILQLCLRPASTPPQGELRFLYAI